MSDSEQGNKNAFATGNTIEQTIAILKASGCSVTDTIKLLVRNREMSLADAKHAVHCSEAWAEYRRDFDMFHKNLDEAMRPLHRNDKHVDM